MTQHVSKWWQKWGQTVIWVISALSTAFLAYRELDHQLDDIALRLQRIEIVLRIDPLTKDLPLRTAATESDR